MSTDVVNTVYDFDGYRLRKMKQSKCDSTDAATRNMAWIAEKYNMHKGVGIYSPSQEIDTKLPDKRLIAFESLCENLFSKQAMYYFQTAEDGQIGRDFDELYEVNSEMLGNHGVWGIKVVSGRIAAFAEKMGSMNSRTSMLLADTVDIAYLKAAYRFGGTLPSLCEQTRDVAIARVLGVRD